MKQDAWTISAANETDIPALAAFSIETFYDTYQTHNTPEDMEEYVRTYFSIDQLTAELKTAGTYFFIAKEAGKIIGYTKLRDQKKPTAIQSLDPIELERIYVHPSQKGKGVGRALLDKACDFARANQYKTLWLGVWEKNVKAIRFYEQYGFSHLGKQIFVLGKDEQQDLQYMIALS